MKAVIICGCCKSEEVWMSVIYLTLNECFTRIFIELKTLSIIINYV